MTAHRSIIVTGAASGIGEATARRLGSGGWALVCVDTDAEALEALTADLSADGVTTTAITGDVASPDTHERACAAARDLGPLAAWVGVAGVAPSLDLRRVPESEVRRITDINQFGMLWGTTAALRLWQEQASGGTVVMVSSVHATHAAADSGVYEMTKASLDALVRNIAVSYGAEGIRAVAVAPGAILTPALARSFAAAADPDAARHRLERQAPLRRLGRSEEIAAAIAFLVSEDAAFITGTTLTVDGGLTSVLLPPA